MKYQNSCFSVEAVHIKRTPQTANETYNKLCCLIELEQMFGPRAKRMIHPPLSKRRNRLVKMYWAFRKTEQNSNKA